MTHHRNYSEAKRKRALKTLSKVAMVDNKKEFNKVELGPQDYFKSEQNRDTVVLKKYGSNTTSSTK